MFQFDKTKHEEALAQGREHYERIFTGNFADRAISLLEGTNKELDNILYTIFHDSVAEGFIQDMGDVKDGDGYSVFMTSSKHLRTLMYTAFVVGMYEQDMSHKLTTMWGVDKSPEPGLE